VRSYDSSIKALLRSGVSTVWDNHLLFAHGNSGGAAGSPASLVAK
jgi:hypothetical protein